MPYDRDERRAEGQIVWWIVVGAVSLAVIFLAIWYIWGR